VLNLLAEEARYGFVLAKVLRPAGELGQVYSVPTSIVYRALSRLEGQALIRVSKRVASSSGPQRVLYEATPAGLAEVERWLGEPVEHLRDLRTLLMLKLAFLHRRRRDASGLIARQLGVLTPIVAGLEARARAESGFGAVLAAWRLESAQAALRFLEGVRPW
jgi:PadR family transcriptional regulator AphA